MKKRSIALVELLLVFIGIFSMVYAQNKESLFAYCSNVEACYNLNEEITFLIEYKGADGALVPGKTVSYNIAADGGFTKQGTITTAATPVPVTYTQTVPGFVRLTVKSADNADITFMAGAGVAVDKIQPGSPDPADFDEYWQKEIAAVKSRAATMKVIRTQIHPYEKYDDVCDVWDVRLEDGVFNATGTLCIPKGAKEKSLPLVMSFNGANIVGASEPTDARNAARDNKIVFHMNLHDTQNIVARNSQEWRDLRNSKQVKRYQWRDADKLGEYPIATIFRRVVRCKEWLKTLPEWNGRILIVAGGSMGGAQAIFAAAFDPQVSLCIACAPALSDHLGCNRKQFSGYPQLVDSPEYKGKPSWENVQKVAPYYDTVNFAKRIKCEIVTSAGFIDTTCPATGIYAAYNAMTTPNKKIYNVPLGIHGKNLDPRKPVKPGVFHYGGDRAKEYLKK